MPDFAKGKIYKITYGDETYYGSTVMTLKKRMWGHKGNYKRWKKGTGSNCRSYTLFDKYGFENCPIELVEDYPCQTKKELLIREDWYIKNMEGINEISAHTSREEDLEQKRQWHQDHKKECNEKSRQWYQDHKEQHREKRQQWHEAHREEMNEYLRQWQQNNKEAIIEKRKETMACECGRTVSKPHIARHRKSAFHLANI